MSSVGRDWARRERENYEKILAGYPFDGVANQSMQRTRAIRSGQSIFLVQWRLAPAADADRWDNRQ